MILNRVPARRLNASGKISEVRAGPGARNQELVLLEFLERLHLRRVPRHRQTDVAIHAAEPGELERIDIAFVLAEHRLERQSAPDRTHDGAVLGRDPVNVFLGLEPAGTGHVLDDDRRLAGNVVAEVASEQPRIDVVGRARAGKDDHAELAALVELLRRLGARHLRAGREQQRTAAAIAKTRRARLRMSPPLRPRNTTRKFRQPRHTAAP